MRNQIRAGKGVRKTPNGKWQSRIAVNKNKICLGTFKYRKDAVDAYNKASKELHGKYGKPTY